MVQWIMTCVSTATFSINVNEEKYGYFKGGRGIRQGDPISPYLFTLVMEMLNIVVQNKINENPRFRYHWGCKQLKISHLCFADDLLMFCHGDVESVRVIKGALDEFSMISSLVPNMGKSTVFFGNIRERTKQEIIDIMPFKVGSLPVTYLGVPLVTKQLGRLQLISSVLSSIHVYWDSVFMLPKDLIKHQSVNTNAKVIDMWSKNGWRWPSVLNDNPLIQTIPYVQL
ncbi:RNA-directed DNA polymerase, eukaryota, reverse transcriptase zinc-binding domain protein [Tanacetum coccineum]